MAVARKTPWVKHMAPGASEGPSRRGLHLWMPGYKLDRDHHPTPREALSCLRSAAMECDMGSFPTFRGVVETRIVRVYAFPGGPLAMCRLRPGCTAIVLALRDLGVLPAARATTRLVLEQTEGDERFDHGGAFITVIPDEPQVAFHEQRSSHGNTHPGELADWPPVR